MLISLMTYPVLAKEQRIALIIGNNNYQHLPVLNNAVTDARSMAAKLGERGFETILRVNAKHREMHRALSIFQSKLASGGTGLVFFAGHGIQSGSRNFLMPVDALVEVEDDLEAEAMDAQRILVAMEEAGNPLNIVILDACRDNPLPRRKRSAARGLTMVQIPKGAKGTAILYSAGPGESAEDGAPGGNGIFTGELLKAMDNSGMTLEQVFKETSRNVLAKTNNRQRPWALTSIQGDFYFLPPDSVSGPNIKKPRPGNNVSQGALDLAFWDSVKGSEDKALYSAYIDEFPEGKFVSLAKIELAKLQQAVKPKAGTANFEGAATLKPGEGQTTHAKSNSDGEKEREPVPSDGASLLGEWCFSHNRGEMPASNSASPSHFMFTKVNFSSSKRSWVHEWCDDAFTRCNSNSLGYVAEKITYDAYCTYSMVNTASGRLMKRQCDQKKTDIDTGMKLSVQEGVVSYFNRCD